MGLGVLGLLAEAGQHSPLLCVVDDAHWLDPESLDVLTFVARRLQAESVAVLFASRNDPAMDVRLAGLVTLRLEGLAPAAAVALLGRTLDSPIDPVAAARIARATGGNPLALDRSRPGAVDRQLTASSLADEPLPVGHRLVEHYVRQVRQLPGSVQTWLLIAAADSTGNLELIGRAAGRSASPPGREMPLTGRGWSIWTR